MKKMFALVLIVVMLLSLVACGKKDDKLVVGVCQLTPHVALDAATQGFIDALKEALGEENVEIKVEIGGGDTATCSPIVNAFVAPISAKAATKLITATIVLLVPAFTFLRLSNSLTACTMKITAIIFTTKASIYT